MHFAVKLLDNMHIMGRSGQGRLGSFMAEHPSPVTRARSRSNIPDRDQMSKIYSQNIKVKGPGARGQKIIKGQEPYSGDNDKQ